MSKEELIQELININSSFINNINAKPPDLLIGLTSLHQNMIGIDFNYFLLILDIEVILLKLS